MAGVSTSICRANSRAWRQTPDFDQHVDCLNLGQIERNPTLAFGRRVLDGATSTPS
jgi:hypothetical protein